MGGQSIIHNEELITFSRCKYNCIKENEIGRICRMHAKDQIFNVTEKLCSVWFSSAFKCKL
jgi:hypothetical protein